MIEYKKTASALGETDWINLATTSVNASDDYTIVVQFSSDYSALVDVEFAIESDLTDPTIICHDVLNNLETTIASTVMTPMSAIRLNVKSYKGGTITLKLLQA